MNTSYNAVDSILIPHSSFVKATNTILQCLKAAKSSSDPICLALVGDSRTGKTRILKHIEKKYRSRRTKEGMRIPILRVSVPVRPTIKGLAEEILLALGDPNPGKGTVSSMTSKIATQVREVKTIAMMVDEFQHFYDKEKHKVMHDVADWFKVLVDRCQIALITSGLQSSQSVLNLNEQLAGRFMAPIFLPRFDWNNVEQREEFIAILEAFQTGLAKYDLPQLDSDDMAFRFYCASGGLIGYIAKILRKAVWNAVEDSRQKIELKDFAKAWEEAIYRDEAKLELPNPFEKGFTVQINEDLLARVGKIGTPLPEEPKPKATRTKRKAPSIAEVLHT